MKDFYGLGDDDGKTDDEEKDGSVSSEGKLNIFTSAKEVMFLPEFVCMSVCVSAR